MKLCQLLNFLKIKFDDSGDTSLFCILIRATVGKLTFRVSAIEVSIASSLIRNKMPKRFESIIRSVGVNKEMKISSTSLAVNLENVQIKALSISFLVSFGKCLRDKCGIIHILIYVE